MCSSEVSFAAVREWAERACRWCSRDASGEAVSAVALALHETVRNVVEHAYGERGLRGPVELRARRRRGTLVVSVVHDGDGFERAAVPAPAFDGSRERGFGVFLAESAVDRVAYGRTAEGRQQIRLEKRVA